MGVDVALYLGPTVMVAEKKIEYPSHLYCCSSFSCKKHKKEASKNEKFCSSCGSPNQNKDIVEHRSLEPYDNTAQSYDYWYGLFVNHSVDERIIYVPNFYLDQHGIYSVEDSEKYSEFDFDLSSVDFAKNLEMFKALPETQELLELLSHHYLKDEITIGYRLFKYTC